MTFEQFQRHAEQMWTEIPPEFREGVHLVVERRAVPHPELEGIWTLGECATGDLDPGAGERDWRSSVHLYHGSFARLAAESEDGYDWEGELWETLVHEVRHHRESVAGEDALEDFDYAADENFKRRDGLPFDPLFYRSGEPAGDRTWEVDGDLFVERELDAAAFAARRDLAVVIDGAEVEVPLPDEQGDVHYVYLDGLAEGDADTVLVLLRRAGAWASMRALFRRQGPVVLESTVHYADGEDDAG